MSNAKQKTVVRIAALSPGQGAPAFSSSWFPLRSPQKGGSRLHLAIEGVPEGGAAVNQGESELSWASSPLCSQHLASGKAGRVKPSSIRTICYFKVSLSWPLFKLFIRSYSACSKLPFFFFFPHKIPLFILLINNSWKSVWSVQLGKLMTF